MEPVQQALEQMRQQERLEWLQRRLGVRDEVLRSLRDRFSWQRLRPNGFPPPMIGR